MTHPWTYEHPGWGSFTDHFNSKWNTRFVVTAVNNEIKQIIEYLTDITGKQYEFIQFDEEKLFPGEREYQPQCVYFFSIEDRHPEYPLTMIELQEVYWY